MTSQGHNELIYMYIFVYISAGLNNSLDLIALGNKKLPGGYRISRSKLLKANLKITNFLDILLIFTSTCSEGNFHLRERKLNSVASLPVRQPDLPRSCSDLITASLPWLHHIIHCPYPSIHNIYVSDSRSLPCIHHVTTHHFTNTWSAHDPKSRKDSCCACVKSND